MKLSQFKMFFLLFLSFILLFTAEDTWAATLNVATILENFAAVVPDLMRLVTATGYVMGMFMIFRGITELKQFGESRTMMSREHSLQAPLVSILAGTLLIYLPSSIQASMTTFWTEPTPYAYIKQAKDSWDSVYDCAYMIIGLIGTVAFIRGVLLLTHTSGHGQQGSFMKSMSFMIAGTLCVNLYQFIQTISLTLGID